MIHVLLLLACVVDRTGRSAPSAMQRELSEHGRRIREIEVVSEDFARRLGQLEEVTRARGQDEILKMETMEQLRQEVARVRGDLEVLQRDYGTFEASGLGFQQDVDGRLLYAEQRVAALEKSLGLKAPPRDGAAAVAGGATSTTTPPPPTVAGIVTPPAPAGPAYATPDEAFTLIQSALADGNGGVARAVANRFLAENPKHDRAAEAQYRVAESWQNEARCNEAVSAFQAVIDGWPQSTWAPWSMLRQGECFATLGKPDDAKVFYGEVVRLYPKSKAAKEAKEHLGR
jgi:tol-pal system protein YbgF